MPRPAVSGPRTRRAPDHARASVLSSRGREALASSESVSAAARASSSARPSSRAADDASRELKRLDVGSKAGSHPSGTNPSARARARPPESEMPSKPATTSSGIGGGVGGSVADNTGGNNRNLSGDTAARPYHSGLNSLAHSSGALRSSSSSSSSSSVAAPATATPTATVALARRRRGNDTTLASRCAQHGTAPLASGAGAGAGVGSRFGAGPTSGALKGAVLDVSASVDAAHDGKDTGKARTRYQSFAPGPGQNSTPGSTRCPPDAQTAPGPSARSRQLAACPGPNRALRGLSNIGNTCFMNSALQCLSSTPAFIPAFVDGSYARDINRSNPLGCKGELATEFASLMAELWGAGQSDQKRGDSTTHRSGSAVTPTAFKRVIAKVAPIFSGYAQQDAHELLSFLLDGLHEDLNRVREKATFNAAECLDEDEEQERTVAKKRWQQHLSRNQSLVVDYFHGQLCSRLTCPHCSRTSITFDPFASLSVPLPSGSTVRRGNRGGGPPGELPAPTARSHILDCLDLFTREEKLNRKNGWYCGGCKDHVQATKRLGLWKLPDVLVIHLKRFQQTSAMRRTKIDTLVRFPLDHLDLTEYIEPHSPHRQHDVNVYNLFAVVNHMGGLGGGHYTAAARMLPAEGAADPAAADTQWHEFNDASVSTRARETVESPAAYLLFYSRCERSQLIAHHKQRASARRTDGSGAVSNQI